MDTVGDQPLGYISIGYQVQHMYVFLDEYVTTSFEQYSSS